MFFNWRPWTAFFLLPMKHYWRAQERSIYRLSVSKYVRLNSANLSSEYLRIGDEQLDLKLEAFGVALIVGPKGCGKTTTAKQKAKSYIEFQDEDERENYLLIANVADNSLPYRRIIFRQIAG